MNHLHFYNGAELLPPGLDENTIPDVQTVPQTLSFFLRWYICLSRKDSGPPFLPRIDHVRSLQKKTEKCCSVLQNNPHIYRVWVLGGMWTLLQELSQLLHRQPSRHSHRTWCGKINLGLVLVLALLLYTFIGAHREVLLQHSRFIKSINGGWIWGRGIKLGAQNLILQRVPTP